MIHFLKKYHLLLLLILLVIPVFFAIVTSRSTQEQQQDALPFDSAPSPQPITTPVTLSEEEKFAVRYQPHEFHEEDLVNIQQKQILPDGSIRYIYASDNQERPNIALVKDDKPLYQRSTISKTMPTSLSSYTSRLGSPEATARGSRFYGSDKITYFYAREGIAFLIDPVTSFVLEQHFFLPMTAHEYKNLYGEDMIGELQ